MRLSNDPHEQRYNAFISATVLHHLFYAVYCLLNKFFVGNRGYYIAFGAKREYLRLSFVGQAAR